MQIREIRRIRQITVQTTAGISDKKGFLTLSILSKSMWLSHHVHHRNHNKRRQQSCKSFNHVNPGSDNPLSGTLIHLINLIITHANQRNHKTTAGISDKKGFLTLSILSKSMWLSHHVHHRNHNKRRQQSCKSFNHVNPGSDNPLSGTLIHLINLIITHANQRNHKTTAGISDKKGFLTLSILSKSMWLSHHVHHRNHNKRRQQSCKSFNHVNPGSDNPLSGTLICLIHLINLIITHANQTNQTNHSSDNYQADCQSFLI